MIGVLTTMINLDTHVVIFALEDNLNLADREAIQTERLGHLQLSFCGRLRN